MRYCDRLITSLLITGAVGLVLMSHVAHCDEILFHDDFEDGNADDWAIVEFGYCEMVDGACCLLPFCEP